MYKRQAPERAQSLANDSDNAAEEVEHQIEPKLYRVGETAIVDDAYAITIIGVVETEERNQFSDKQVEQVLIIDYIYENLSLADEDIDVYKRQGYDSTKAFYRLVQGRKIPGREFKP